MSNLLKLTSIALDLKRDSDQPLFVQLFDQIRIRISRAQIEAKQGLLLGFCPYTEDEIIANIDILGPLYLVEVFPL